ncbi:hypothetical protein D3C85_364730 [compost metagenome]
MQARAGNANPARVRGSVQSPAPVLGHAGVAAGPHRQIAAAQGADAHKAFKQWTIKANEVIERAGVVRNIAAEVDPPGCGHVLTQGDRDTALADAVTALTPQPVADPAAAYALIGEVAIGRIAGHVALNRQQQVAAVLGIPGLIVSDSVGVTVEVRPDPGVGQTGGGRQRRARLVEDVVTVQRQAADLGRGRARRIDAVERHLAVVAARQQVQRPHAGADDAEVLHQLHPLQPVGVEAVGQGRLRVHIVAVRQDQVARVARTGQVGRRAQGAAVG